MDLLPAREPSMMRAYLVAHSPRWYACGNLLVVGALLCTTVANWIIGHPWRAALGLLPLALCLYAGWSTIAVHWYEPGDDTRKEVV